MTMSSPSEAGGRQVERSSVTAFLTDQESRKAVSNAASDLSEVRADVQAGTILKAIRHLDDHRSPNVLIVDISGEDDPLRSMEDLANVCEPGTAVIVVGERNDVNLYRDLMECGVSDYLVKPLDDHRVQRSLTAVNDTPRHARRSARQGRVVTFASVRGGAGATTLAAGLAWTLAHRRHRRVALVDLDLQYGSAALALDLAPSCGLREALEQSSQVDDLLERQRSPAGPDLLTIIGSEGNIGENAFVDADAFAAFITRLCQGYNYIIIDAPRSQLHQVEPTSPLRSDLAFVTDLSLVGLRDALRLLARFERTGTGRPPLVVANRIGEYREGEISLKDFERALGRRVDLAIPFAAQSMPCVTTTSSFNFPRRRSMDAALQDLADRIVGGPASRDRRAARLWPFGGR